VKFSVKWRLNSGFRIQDSGFRIQDSVVRIQDSGFRIQDSGFRIQDSGFRSQESGLPISGVELFFFDSSFFERLPAAFGDL